MTQFFVLFHNALLELLDGVLSLDVQLGRLVCRSRSDLIFLLLRIDDFRVLLLEFGDLVRRLRLHIRNLLSRLFFGLGELLLKRISLLLQQGNGRVHGLARCEQRFELFVFLEQIFVSGVDSSCLVFGDEKLLLGKALAELGDGGLFIRELLVDGLELCAKLIGLNGKRKEASRLAEKREKANEKAFPQTH